MEQEYLVRRMFGEKEQEERFTLTGFSSCIQIKEDVEVMHVSPHDGAIEITINHPFTIRLDEPDAWIERID